MPLPLYPKHRRACGADDDERLPVLNPVLCVGHFWRPLVGQLWRAPKGGNGVRGAVMVERERGFAIDGEIVTGGGEGGAFDLELLLETANFGHGGGDRSAESGKQPIQAGGFFG